MQTALGQAIGKVYVQRHFPPEAKARMDVLVDNLLKAYGRSIRELDWMSEGTKQKALTKLAKFQSEDRLSEQVARLFFALDRSWRPGRQPRCVPATRIHVYRTGKLGKPIDREEWNMTPQTVNAFYNPPQNEIVFPAAFLQPPFFDMTADDAVNYGAHRRGDRPRDRPRLRRPGLASSMATATCTSWWTDEDRRKFERAHDAGSIEQYNGYQSAARSVPQRRS